MAKLKINIDIDKLLEKPVAPLYPHAIMFDFEACLVKSNVIKTDNLLLESEHVPISVSIGDNGSDQITHICDRNPERLIKKFVDELIIRSEKLTESMTKYVPEDMDKLPKTQQEQIKTYLFQVPVLGFNSGHYDLNLIKSYFVSEICGDKG